MLIFCRIIIIVDLTVMMKGSDVGGVIGKPTLMDIVRVDSSKPVPMTTGSGRGFQGKEDQFNGGPMAQQSKPGRAYRVRLRATDWIGPRVWLWTR